MVSAEETLSTSLERHSSLKSLPFLLLVAVGQIVLILVTSSKTPCSQEIVGLTIYPNWVRNLFRWCLKFLKPKFSRRSVIVLWKTLAPNLCQYPNERVSRALRLHKKLELLERLRKRLKKNNRRLKPPNVELKEKNVRRRKGWDCYHQSLKRNVDESPRRSLPKAKMMSNKNMIPLVKSTNHYCIIIAPWRKIWMMSATWKKTNLRRPLQMRTLPRRPLWWLTLPTITILPVSSRMRNPKKVALGRCPLFPKCLKSHLAKNEKAWHPCQTSQCLQSRQARVQKSVQNQAASPTSHRVFRPLETEVTREVWPTFGFKHLEPSRLSPRRLSKNLWRARKSLEMRWKLQRKPTLTFHQRSVGGPSQILVVWYISLQIGKGPFTSTDKKQDFRKVW